MKANFNVYLLLAGTLLTLSPIIYKIVTLITLAILIPIEHQVNLNLGIVDPFLAFAMGCGGIMILIHSHPIAGKKNGLEKPVCPATRQG